MVVSPGAGQDSAVLPLAEAGYLEPLDDSSAALIPEGNEALFQVDGETYAQPTDIVPVGMLWNVGAAAESGVEVPTDTDALIDACETLADEGKSFFAIAGSVPPNPGLMTMAISATRVYAETPDWNQQRAAGDVTFADDEGWQETLQTVVDMNEAGCYPGGRRRRRLRRHHPGHLAGHLAVGVRARRCRHRADERHGGSRAERPAVPAGQRGRPTSCWPAPTTRWRSVPRATTPPRQAAQDFLAWLAEPENAAEFVEISGGVAITGADENISPVFEPVADLLENGDYVALPEPGMAEPCRLRRAGRGCPEV